ncbi:MAG: glycoside hydrolase family 3 protein [Bacteroidaceae bacterium]|nr:glycoside hydrolase family 3 protein [Bacteroidaceae bacterium]
MTRKSLIPIACAALAVIATVSCNREVEFGKSPIKKVVAAMTLEEKVNLLVGVGAWNGNEIAQEIQDAKNLIPGCAGQTYPIPRLGIPSVMLPDGPGGLRINPTRQGDEKTYYCTSFPVATILAQTWNQQLVEEVGTAIGDEVKRYGADCLLAPALNIHRNPLLGRNFEYYSEDPVISGKTAAAMVRGVQSNGVGATIKHYALNNQETNRMANDAQVDQQTAREIYLKGFEIAVRESQPWAVMTSYNKINGTYAPENEDLIEKVLRQEWGFEGMVMTDWGGGRDAVATVYAGNDLLMPGSANQIKAIIEAVQNGTLDEKIVDRNVTRILEFVARSPKMQGYEFQNDPDMTAHAQVSRSSATEGMVLLNNNGALPFAKDCKMIALYGTSSYDLYVVGTGSGSVNYKHAVGLNEGLTAAGFKLEPSISSAYTKYVEENNSRVSARNFMRTNLTNHVIPQSLVRKPYQYRADAISSDIAVITIGRSCGESADRGYEGDYTLTDIEQGLIKDVCDAFHSKGKKVVVILNIGAPIETASWKAQPDAILLAGLPGQEAGHAITDVLKGAVNPSGKLVDTYVVDFNKIPSTANFPVNARELQSQVRANRNNPEAKPVSKYDYTEYKERLDIGYRYFDRHPEQVSYPFGFGLSYTTFSYSDAQAKVEDGIVNLSVKVTNTGSVAGKEAVQVYIEAPQGGLNKLTKELKAYGKTALLQPGESEVLEFKLSGYELAGFNLNASAWQTVKGDYKADFAASSQDVRCQAQFNIAQEQTFPAFGEL